ncbi:VOC family protein [Chryseobacterium pennipullorum]|uniref:VOC family protein n=1 Tax=Chryseobacterium pennipullorum TaxID=2258963 RepID=A0A3D9APS2_9FLAO|nr:VOC family protein [Chryseobacterium pennipullorum]REC43369.1 VOC family protein [Chryseobacterium pennipullorum]
MLIKMNARLDTVILYVQDVQLLKNFYVDHFDLKVIEEDSVWVLLDAGAAYIGLHRAGNYFITNMEDTEIFGSNTKIVFEIDMDINSARNEFVLKNIPMREIKTFENYPFMLCDGTDPEGNVFQLKSRKTR